MNDYANMVLQSMYSSILRIALSDKNIILLDYCNGMVINLMNLIKIMNIDPSFMNQMEVNERMQFHSKSPNDIFKEDEVQPRHFACDKTIRIYNQLKNYQELGI